MEINVSFRIDYNTSADNESLRSTMKESVRTQKQSLEPHAEWQCHGTYTPGWGQSRAPGTKISLSAQFGYGNGFVRFEKI